MRSILIAIFAASSLSAATPTFDVASVKVNPDVRRSYGSIQRSPVTLTMRGISLWFVVRWAYNLENFRLAAPDSLQSPPFYDILAKTSNPGPESQMRMMLQTLLAERFHLKAHFEKREMPVIALVVAKGGSKLRPSAGKYDAALGAEMPMQFLGYDETVHLQRLRQPNGHIQDSFTNFPVTLFAAFLELMTSRSPYDKVAIVDMTGLRGRFDFSMTRDLSANEGEGQFQPTDELAYKGALQKDLGLTLASRKTAVEVLVVDHVDKEPTPN